MVKLGEASWYKMSSLVGFEEILGVLFVEYIKGVYYGVFLALERGLL